jgi:hypothetical protein
MEKLSEPHTKDTGTSKTRTRRSFRNLFSRHRPGRDSTIESTHPGTQSDTNLLTQPDTHRLTDSIRLCSTCRNIDWKLALKGEPSSLVRKVLQIDLQKESDCALCDFILYSLGPYQRLSQHDLLAIQIEPTLTPLINATHSNVSVLGLLPKWDFGFRSMFEFRSDLIFEVSGETASSLKPIQPLVDLHDVRCWLELCIDGHVDCCGLSGIEAHGLQVIDCLSRRVVARPDDAAYATLSYVWGTRNQEQLDTPIARQTSHKRSTLLDLPQTIEDAIKVTLDVGYQYLWVDKYCMDPDNDTFHTQLRQMNLVYQNSVFTIIAAAGHDSLYGLPGISQPREGSPQTRVGEITLSSVPISIVKDLENESWNSRGWTYQEGLLSTRRLIFTNRQVYFECQGCYFFEGILITPTTSSRPVRPTQGGFSGTMRRRYLGVDEMASNSYKLGVFPVNRIGMFGNEIWHRIEEYSDRSLTYDSDILNAMLGLFELFDQLFNVQHFWGIPYPSRDPSAPKSPWRLRKVTFLKQLDWNHRWLPSTRREEFPSWSWTGWHGSVLSWRDAHNLIPITGEWSAEPYYSICNVEFSLLLEKTDGTLIHWDSCEPCDSHITKDEPQASSFDHTEFTRFLHLKVFVSKILPSLKLDHARRGHSSGIIEPESIEGDDVDIDIILDRGECSPSDHQLYALHMPFKTSWMLVIQNFGDHWERVGIVREQRGDTLQRTLMYIRLG